MSDITSSTLPSQLYLSEQVRALDQAAMAKANIPGIVLMKRAGRAAFELLSKQWPRAAHIIVVCGGGNNGGDGYIVAALAAMQRKKVSIYSTSDPAQLKGDAKRAAEFAQQEGLIIQSASKLSLAGEENCVIVDAILGLGFHSPLKDSVASILEKINASELPVLALDVPSGLDPDSGFADDSALRAAHTITFVALKPGLLTGRGPELCGQLHFSDLDIPSSVFESVTSSLARISQENSLPKRNKSAHKNRFGHVLIVAGDRGMGGAGILAAEAALSCGAGLVSLATRSENIAAAQARLPEVMSVAVNAGPELEAHLEKADVIVLGPGLGQSAWSQQLHFFALQARKATVIDADGLNLLAQSGMDESFDSAQWVLTPHPGEAARLLGCASHEVERNRLNSVSSLAKKFNCLAILKGAGTLISDGERISLANVGNPGMAAAGMGDVLSGVLGALLAQKIEARAAVETAVCAHGYAGDRAAKQGETGLRASELMPYLREYLNFQRK